MSVVGFILIRQRRAICILIFTSKRYKLIKQEQLLVELGLCQYLPL